MDLINQYQTENTIQTNRSRCILKCKPGVGLGNHSFPRSDKKMMKLWTDAIGGAHLLQIRNPFLCSRHFEQKYLNFFNGRYHLMRPAIPTIFDNTNKVTDKRRLPKQLNLDNFNPNETCRACFTTKSHKFQSLWDSPNLLALFEKCSYLKVQRNDGLPPTLCSSCVIKCFSWFNFHELCLQTEALFKIMIKNKNPPAGGGSSNNTNTLPKWKQQRPINNANKNPISISDDKEEYGNYIIYKDDSSDSECIQNTNLNDDNIPPEIDFEDQIEKLICLPKITTLKQNAEEAKAEDDDVIAEKRGVDKGLRKKSLSCNKCGEIFINAIMLKLHMSKCYSTKRRHKKEKPFKCNSCGRRFIKKSHFFEHKQRHKKEKPIVAVKSTPVPIKIFTGLLGAKATPVVIAPVPVKTLSSSVGTSVPSVITPSAQVRTTANLVETPTASSKTSTQVDTLADLGETSAVEKLGAQIETSGTSVETSGATVETSETSVETSVPPNESSAALIMT